MPRRKGYGIPPTKRIKIDNEIENNENELGTDVAAENATTNDIQKSQNENYVKEPPTSACDGYPNKVMPMPLNGIKYLHKKFKKMAAILSDDCAASVEAIDKSTIHISTSQQTSSSSALPEAPKTTPDVRVAAAPAAAPQSSLPECAPIHLLAGARVESPHIFPQQQQQPHQSPHNRLPPATTMVVLDEQLALSQQNRIGTAFAAKTNPTAFSSAFCNVRTSSVSLTSLPVVAPLSMAAVAAIAPLVTPPVASATAATATAFVTASGAGHTSSSSSSLVAEEEVGAPAAVGRHACPYCKLVCNKPSVLQKHIRAHTNERPFPCQPCGFAFKTSSNLYKHRRSRSHSLKLEEVGVDGKAATTTTTVAATTAAPMGAFGSHSSGSRCSSASGGSSSVLEEELLICDEEDDSQASSRDADADASSESESGSSGGGSSCNGKVAQPNKSIYKPKFHKASIYIQNNPLATIASAASLLTVSGGEHLATGGSLNKFGLQLKIPVAAGSGSSCNSRSLPSTPSPFSGSSPSPEFLQRHISKLISENQAIVETTDPFWSKKFYSRTSKENGAVQATTVTGAVTVVVSSCASIADTMLNAALPKKKSTTTAMAVLVPAAAVPISAVTVDEKLAVESKLAHALLQPKVTKSISMNDVSGVGEESQPLNLTMCKDMSPSKIAERVTEVIMPVEMVDVKPSVEVLQKQTPAKVPEIKKESFSPSTVKFARPTSLPLKPGSCMPKKLLLPGSVSVLPLVSPETPRPNKSYGQLYIGGNAYTYLGLKCSTRNTFCTLHKSQPTYVPLSPEHNKISMYSNWKVRSEVDPYLRSVPPTKAMACYDSRQRYSPYSVVYGKTKDAVTHSSYWLQRMKGSTSGDGSETQDSQTEEIKENRIREPQVDERRNMVESHEGTNDDEDDDEDGEDFGNDDPKSQLEREVAKSLLSLSKMSHQSVPEGYVNAGLVPLNARPNTYPYQFSALSPMSSKPHTPTLTSISEQKERESVSKNTRLAQELQTCIPSSTCVKQKGGESMAGRYYFVSPVDKDIKTTSTVITTSDLQESAGKGSAVTPVFPIVPIDLSSKTMPERRVPWMTKPPSNVPADDVCYAATTSISEILTPVSEPVLLASICSTIDRLPPAPATAANDVADGSSSVMLQTYLKERAVQDLKIKQQYQSPHIKMDHQRDFDLKYNAYKEAFQIGAAEVKQQHQPPPPPPPHHHHQLHLQQHRREDRTTPSPTKRKNHFTFDGEPPTEKIYAKSDRGGGSDADSSKENYAVAAASGGVGSDAGEKGSGNDCSTSVIIVVGSPNSGSAPPSKRLKAEFISPSNGPLPKYASVLEDGRSKCVVCNKIFNKPSQLRLHVNIHYFEQPFRCPTCAVSFRTKGHLQKHYGSNSHLNKLSMNTTAGGQTSTNNPRPFKCDDCSVGFRIHGHLAKHLRSKMHIMKLECLGKLPFGTYAEMERCGVNMNDIDTTDCENSLESLQRIAKGVVPSTMYVNNADDEGKILINGSQY